MVSPDISAFRAEVPDIPQMKFSFAHHDSQGSIASSDMKSFNTSDEASNQSSATGSDSTVSGDTNSDPVTAMPDTPTVPMKPVKIKYSLEFYDKFKSEWSTITQDDEAFDLAQVNESSDKNLDAREGPPAIFEIVTKADGWDKRRRKFNFEIGAADQEEAMKSEPAEEQKLPPLKFEDIKVTEVTEVRMEIHSKKLLEAVRKVTDYYPNQNLSGDVVIIHEPYWILIHHEKELKQLQKKYSTPGKEGDKEAAEHLKVLLDFVQPQIDRIVPPIQRRLQNKVPTITFDALWYLLRPGTLAYCQFGGEWIGCVIMQVRGKKRESKSITRWNVHVWFLSFTNKLTRPYTFSHSDSDLQTKHSISRYEGEQEITSLPVVPREYWDAIDNGARKKEFETRGARKLKLMSERFQQMNHKGEMLDKNKRLYHGRVILDDRIDIEVSDTPDTLWKWYDPQPSKDEIWMEKRGTGESQRISKLVEFLKLEKDDPKNLTKDQAWLMSPHVYCFALDIKSWGTTHIDRLTAVEENSAATRLVMEESPLKIIKSLAVSQTGAKAAWYADPIKDKGKGVIILLHGPPGVGKTYSVECTAMSIGRPLLALTIADIGTKERSIETELASWFYLAERWKAVLLIDEADIFLERRERKDIARNGVVSAFLRKMEYFSGLLFLTTNRVGHIDEAFMSRVHVVIGYPSLDDKKRRELWEGFFQKMRADTNGNIRVAASAKDYVLQSSEKLGIYLNGREIRNTLQTAISLAEFETREDPDYHEDDKITVAKDHFERVLDMSRSFRRYLDSIRHDTAEDRARNLLWRNDTEDLENM